MNNQDVDAISDPFANAEAHENELNQSENNVIEIEQGVAEGKQQERTDDVVLHGETLDLDEEIAFDEKPEPIKPVANKKVKKASGGGKAISFAAIVLALGAIGTSGYAIKSQMDSERILSESLTSVDSSIGALTQESDERTSSMSQFEQAMKSSAEKIKYIENLRGDVAWLKEELQAIKSGLSVISEEIKVDHAADVESLISKLDNIYDDIEKLKKRPVSQPRKAYVKPKPKPIDKTKLEGAALASLDSWGAKPYAMLRDPSGKWVALTTGDMYKGWRFTHAINDRAVFKKGKTSRELIIEEML